MKIYDDTRMWVRLSLQGKFAVTSEPLAVWVATGQDRLTLPGSYLYQREAVRRSFEVFVGAYARAGDFPADVQKAIRELITYSQANQSKFYGFERHYGMARRRAIECLAFFPKGKTIGKALVGLLFLWVFHMLFRMPRDREES